MSFKEWNAVIQIVGAVLVGAWIAFEIAGGGFSTGLAEAAMKLLWAIGAVIAFNIVATIIVGVLVTVATREEFKDEKADERDDAVNARSSRIGYVVVSAGAALCLPFLAAGADPMIAVYALFAAPLLGGVAESVARLVYYRLG